MEEGWEEEIILAVIYYRDFHGYISTDLLIHPWLFLFLFPPLWKSGFVFASQSVYVVNDFLCLFFHFSSQDICYFLPLQLISLRIHSTKVYPCGDHWPNFIISVLVFQLHFNNNIYVLHLRFYLSLALILGDWRYHCSERWGAFFILKHGFS